MSASITKETSEARENLDANFPGRIALLLTPVCMPAQVHAHPQWDQEEGKWSYIPCRDQGKRPLGSGWNRHAIDRYAAGTGRDQHLNLIVDHFSGGGNIGLVVPPGTLAIDSDSLESMQWIAIAIPDAPIQRTRSGAHFMVKAPPDLILKAEVKVPIANGVTVDLRVAGKSQIVVEPSRHLSGDLYTWISSLPKDLDDLPECPPLVVEAIRKHSIDGSGKKAVVNQARSFTVGERNSSLMSLAGGLRQQGFDHEEIRASLEVLNARRCEPPLSANEVASISTSVTRYEPGNRNLTYELNVEVPRQPYRLIPFNEFQSERKEDYLVRSLIGRGQLGALIGAPGMSKTFLALDLGMAVATGSPWHGLQTHRGRVVYIASEGARGVQNRLKAIRIRKAPIDPDVSFFVVADVVRLTEASDDVDRLITSVRAVVGPDGLDLIVVDTLSRAIAGLDENRSEAMTGAVAAADRLRLALGAAVLLVHHAGKDGARGARGHSSLKAALDVELEVTKVANAFSVTVTKSRDYESGQSFFHRLEPVEIGVDNDGVSITSCVVVPIDGANDSRPAKLGINEQRTLKAIRALLTGSAGLTSEEPQAVQIADLHRWIEKNCKIERNLRRGVVRKGLEGLKKKGVVTVENGRALLLSSNP